MAQYLVRLDNKYYANRVLVKHIFRIGDSGVLSLLAKNVITPREILGSVVYEISSKAAIDRAQATKSVVVQNIDAQVRPHVLSDRGGLPQLEIEKPNEVYLLNGVQYVPLREIGTETTRYRLIRDVPHIEFLGKKYVAVGVRLNNKPCRVAVIQYGN